MTVGELIERLQAYSRDTEVGVTRGLYFAPLSEIDSLTLSTKFKGMVDRFNGESGNDRIVKLTFMSNSEVANRADSDA